MTVRILIGDVREQLATLLDQSVHCCVTSPPYWGLRDYGMPGQIGLEKSPTEFVETMVQVFREVRRVLRDDGTCWVNLGDSYATGAGKATSPGGGAQGEKFKDIGPSGYRGAHELSPKHSRPQVPDGKNPSASIPTFQPNRMPIAGLKPKDLCGIPWRVAFALQADGWYLRQDIIWRKPNPMPESVRDRCTKAHEYIFLLSKSERYYFDADAIAEPAGYAHEAKYDNGLNGHGGGESHAGQGSSTRKFKSGNLERKPPAARGVPANNPLNSWNQAGSVPLEGITRNKRSVWTVPTAPFKEAHFATFPPALIEPCILAGCPEGGTVLDPFGGAGTTGLVADRHKRNAILIELNPEYAAMAKNRIIGDAPMFAEVTT